jgi:hypothetical protein
MKNIIILCLGLASIILFLIARFFYKMYKKEVHQKNNSLVRAGELNSQNEKYILQIERCKDKKIIEKLFELNSIQNITYVVTTTKHREKVIVVTHYLDGNWLNEINVWGFYQDKILVNKTTLLFSVKCMDNILKMKIDDIPNFSYRDKGYGTIAMNALLSLAKLQNVSEITGKLMPRDITDDDERNRRVCFYQHKFGFTINWINSEKNEGTIYLRLSEGVSLNTFQI